MHRSEKVAKGELEVSCRLGWYRELSFVSMTTRQHFIESPIGTFTVSLLVLLAAQINVKGFVLFRCNWPLEFLALGINLLIWEES